MGNSDTSHSKALRAATASAAKSAALKSGKKKKIQMLGNAELIDYVRLNLREVPGETALKKFKFLINFYKNNKNNA